MDVPDPFRHFWVLHVPSVFYVSGWRRLAQVYKAADSPRGKSFYMRSGGVGLISYRSCLNVSVTPEGMFLSVFPLFRLCHPTLFIPWASISGSVAKNILTTICSA